MELTSGAHAVALPGLPSGLGGGAVVADSLGGGAHGGTILLARETRQELVGFRTRGNDCAATSGGGGGLGILLHQLGEALGVAANGVGTLGLLGGFLGKRVLENGGGVELVDALA